MVLWALPGPTCQEDTDGRWGTAYDFLFVFSSNRGFISPSCRNIDDLGDRPKFLGVSGTLETFGCHIATLSGGFYF